MKRTGLLIICVGVAFSLLLGTAIAKETVVVYTSLETEETVDYLELAKKELPDLDIQAIRLSTGELGARMLAEKDNPQADCIWGWAVTNMSEFVPKGMLVPYKPKGWDKIPAHFKDPDGYWVAIDLYAAALVPNTKVLKSKNLPMPKGWNDLLNPVYKDMLIMPNPASSGTGFLQVASLLVMLDPDYKNKPIEKNMAWDFLKKLDKNMGQYIKSGSKPAKLTAAGEYAIGCSFEGLQDPIRMIEEIYNGRSPGAHPALINRMVLIRGDVYHYPILYMDSLSTPGVTHTTHCPNYTILYNCLCSHSR